jgi:DNA-binding NarL/FixJ family response regulator
MHARNTDQVRILVADDHEAVRKGVCAILAIRLDIEVRGEATNGQEAIAKAHALKPDLIILDYNAYPQRFGCGTGYSLNPSGVTDTLAYDARR